MNTFRETRCAYNVVIITIYIIKTQSYSPENETYLSFETLIPVYEYSAYLYLLRPYNCVMEQKRRIKMNSRFNELRKNSIVNPQPFAPLNVFIRCRRRRGEYINITISPPTKKKKKKLCNFNFIIIICLSCQRIFLSSFNE